MDYKNIDISKLGLKQKIIYQASRVSLLVPRLLSKLAKKVVGNPVTKLVTGESYDTVKSVAIDVASQVQNVQANAMQEAIDTGKQNLESWRNDEEYYISNLGKYKSYKSYINDLEKKQVKLRKSPKRLLVLKTYLATMKSYRQKHKQEKADAKMVQAIISEYQTKKASIEAKQEEIIALQNALQSAQNSLATMQQEFNSFVTENSEIVNEIENEVVESQVDNQTVEPPEYAEMMNEIGQFVQQNMPAPSTVETMENEGLSSQIKQGPIKIM